MKIIEIVESSLIDYPSSKVRAYVYMGTRRVSGEYYFGYRELNLKKNRISSDDLPLYKTSSKNVKHRFDEFDWQILAEFENGDDAFIFEQLLIKEHWGDPLLLNKQYREPNGAKKFKSNNGYWKGKTKSPETNAKVSAKLMGHPGAWAGKTQSADLCAKKSQSMKGKNTWMAGSTRSEESKLKTSQTLKGKNTWSKGKKWWNNGVISKTSFEQPGPEWTPGRLKYAK